MMYISNDIKKILPRNFGSSQNFVLLNDEHGMSHEMYFTQ